VLRTACAEAAGWPAMSVSPVNVFADPVQVGNAVAEGGGSARRDRARPATVGIEISRGVLIADD